MEDARLAGAKAFCGQVETFASIHALDGHLCDHWPCYASHGGFLLACHVRCCSCAVAAATEASGATVVAVLNESGKR